MNNRGKYIIWVMVLTVVAYATYIHGYMLTEGVKLPLFEPLEIIPWWIPGTYLFLPAYWLMNIANHIFINLPMKTILVMLVAIHIVYVMLLARICVWLGDLIRRKYQAKRKAHSPNNQGVI